MKAIVCDGATVKLTPDGDDENRLLNLIIDCAARGTLFAYRSIAGVDSVLLNVAGVDKWIDLSKMPQWDRMRHPGKTNESSAPATKSASEIPSVVSVALKFLEFSSDAGIPQWYRQKAADVVIDFLLESKGST